MFKTVATNEVAGIRIKQGRLTDGSMKTLLLMQDILHRLKVLKSWDQNGFGALGGAGFLPSIQQTEKVSVHS